MDTSEEALRVLESDPNYRILRRFDPETIGSYRTPTLDAPPLPLSYGAYLDVETTGLDTERDEIIELAILPFAYDPNGIAFTLPPSHWYNQPIRPIPPEVTELTGISAVTVAGHSIDFESVDAVLANVRFVVAHHAVFDRRMLERVAPAFRSKRWACSYREVDWKAFGADSAKLRYLLSDLCGEFYSAHNALDDCRVGVHVLQTATLDGRTAFSLMREHALQRTVRIYAVGAPFKQKDELKARGYEWSSGEDGRLKAWFVDLHSEDSARAAEEIDYLHSIGVSRQVVFDFDAVNRYSIREP